MLRITALLVFLLTSASAIADIYKWTDEDGEVHYSDTPPPHAMGGAAGGEPHAFTDEQSDDPEQDDEEANGSSRRGPVGVATGWAITPRHVLTNYHVIANAQSVKVALSEENRVPVKVEATDTDHDLALLRFTDESTRLEPIPVQTEQAALGSKVTTIGYPHVDVMGSAPKVTTGVISSVRGMNNDERLYQISAPVQAGNSGGPLFNKRGEVVGIVVGKLNASAVARSRGDLPQNVNYAVKSRYLEPWLDDGAADSSNGSEVSIKELVARVRDSVVMVIVR